MQTIRYHLTSYTRVLEKTKAVEAVEGKVVSVDVREIAFYDTDNLFSRHFSKTAVRYVLTAKVPMSAAIRFC